MDWPICVAVVSLSSYALASYRDHVDGLSSVLCCLMPISMAMTMQVWEEYPADQHVWTLTGLAFLIFFSRATFAVKGKVLSSDLDRVLEDTLSLAFTGTASSYAIIALRGHDPEVCVMTLGGVQLGYITSSIFGSVPGGVLVSAVAIWGHAAYHETGFSRGRNALFCAWVALLITESSKAIFAHGHCRPASKWQDILANLIRGSFFSLCILHYVSVWQGSTIT